jgi:sugar transferase (PEP-CTERM/EpsH1 system associated)
MHVVHALRPGGMEFGVVKLVNGLDPARVRSAICSTKRPEGLNDLVRPGVPIFTLRRRAGTDLRLVGELYRLLRREQPHVVHTHGWGTLLEGLTAARLAGVPVVIHGEHGTLQLRPHQRWLQRRGWSAADQVLSVSTRLAERMSRETGFARARIRTIRNGVDLSRFGHIARAVARRQLDLAADASVIVTVGRLVPVKDHLTLLESVAELRRDGREATLVVAGEGPLKSTLVERAVSLGIDRSVRLVGHRPDVELVLAAADVFALSSESEGLCNTILEAMASGLPVVATRVGGADEMVQDGITGLLVPARSPRELARALDSVLSDTTLRRSLGAAGRARAESEFSLAGMMQRYEELYIEVTASKPAFFVRHRSSSVSPEQSGAA